MGLLVMKVLSLQLNLFLDNILSFIQEASAFLTEALKYFNNALRYRFVAFSFVVQGSKLGAPQTNSNAG